MKSFPKRPPDSISYSDTKRFNYMRKYADEVDEFWKQHQAEDEDKQRTNEALVKTVEKLVKDRQELKQKIHTEYEKHREQQEGAIRAGDLEERNFQNAKCEVLHLVLSLLPPSEKGSRETAQGCSHVEALKKQ